MPRKRMIDPAIWESEQVMSLNERQFKLYIYLITHADDEGRIRVSYPMIASRAYPMEPVTSDQVRSDIGHMHDIELVMLYGDERYLLHPNWTRYQTINRPTESRIPAPEAIEGNETPFTEGSVSDHGGLSESSVSAHGGLTPNRREEKGIEEKRTERARECSVSTKWPKDSLEQTTLATFMKDTPTFADVTGNLQAVPELVRLASARGDPTKVLPAMVTLFERLRKGELPNMRDKKFWSDQPFTPKGMLSLWDRIVPKAEGVIKTAVKRQRVNDFMGDEEDDDGDF